MIYTTLGATGLKVSRLCFGTMPFGGDADEATSALSPEPPVAKDRTVERPA